MSGEILDSAHIAVIIYDLVQAGCPHRRSILRAVREVAPEDITGLPVMPVPWHDARSEIVQHIRLRIYDDVF